MSDTKLKHITVRLTLVVKAPTYEHACSEVMDRLALNEWFVEDLGHQHFPRGSLLFYRLSNPRDSKSREITGQKTNLSEGP